MKKKRILFIAIILLICLGVYLFAQRPANTVIKFCNAMKDFDKADASSCFVSEDAGIELPTEEEITDQISVYLKDCAKKITYTIDKTTVNKNSAVVSVTFTYVDASGIFSAAMADYMTKSLTLAFADMEEYAEEDLFYMIFKEKIEFAEPKMITSTIDFPCVKKNNVWKIQSLSDRTQYEILKILTCNISDIIESLDDNSKDDDSENKKTTKKNSSKSQENNVPKVTFSASIGEINGTVYCARQVYGEDEFGMYEAKTVPTCKLLPVETYELGVVSSFCYYDGYVYYIVSEEGSSDYSSWLYRCKPNWTGTELLDEIICTQYPFQMGERFFVIDNGVLYYRNYDAQNPPTAIHLETQTKYNSMPPKYMVDGEKRTYDVEIYNDIMFFTEDNIVYKIENGKKILLATNAYLDGGCTSDYFYYSEMDNIGYMVFLYRIPINGGEKELIDSKILMGGGGPYFSW